MLALVLSSSNNVTGPISPTSFPPNFHFRFESTSTAGIALDEIDTLKKAKELGFVDQAGDTTQLRVFNLSVTLTHELGHMLGLKHDEEKGSYDVMDPYYNGMTQLSKNDIRRILLKYTARVYRRFRGYARLKKWLIRVHKRL